MDLMSVRQAICDITATHPYLDGWQFFPYIVDQFPSPSMFVCDPTELMYDDIFGATSIRFQLAIRFVVTRSNEKLAHEILSTIISTGTDSIKELFDNHVNLNGTVESSRMLGVGRFARFRTGGGDAYLGVEPVLEIIAS